ncbi:MAG: DUF4292 domain-containing protein [Culturomica sp.]|jgi:hypothetical protein|nr:DUF4292 domain-containing protein [Culturomica sp.]
MVRISLKGSRGIYRYIIFILLISFVFVSCKSVKNISKVREIPQISENKLYRYIEANQSDFRTLYAKKMEVSFSDDNKKITLNGSLKIQRDSFIWISISAPLGIEVARVLITQDSIKFTDNLNKRYLRADYYDIYKRYGLNINYKCIENIFSNIFFNLETCIDERDAKPSKFVLTKSPTTYELSSVHKRALNRKLKKFYKKKSKHKDYTLIYQTIEIHPDYFRPTNISLKDMDADTEINVNYNNFTSFEGNLFPSKVSLDISFDKSQLQTTMKFSRLEFNVDVKPNFKISSKYKEIK